LESVNSVEQTLRRAWCEVLKAADAGDADNFFTAGGHSFAAVELLAKVESALGIKFPFEAFMADATLGALISACRDRVAEAQHTRP
jgi:acyl carrier protein